MFRIITRCLYNDITNILSKKISVEKFDFKKNEYISRTITYKQFLQSFPEAWVENGILLGGLNSTFHMFQYFCCYNVFPNLHYHFLGLSFLQYQIIKYSNIGESSHYHFVSRYCNGYLKGIVFGLFISSFSLSLGTFNTFCNKHILKIS